MLQQHVNIAAIPIGVSPPPWGYIDDNTTSRAAFEESLASMNLYKSHLRLAGLPDKERWWLCHQGHCLVTEVHMSGAEATYLCS